MKKLVSALFLACVTLSASASSLNLKMFNPGSDAIFPVASTLVYGDHDAVLVDAQFQKKYAQQLVDIVKKSGKNLKYIFISHSDPDYYFGLDEIKKAFPNAQVISTAQTAYLISATKDAKMSVWKEQLASDAPGELYVPEAITSNQIKIDNQVIEIKQDKKDTAHSYLWIPSLRTILGGIPVSTGEHLWMADTQTDQDIDMWIARIEDMQALKPEKVIPGHYLKSDTNPASLSFIKQYLIDYKQATASHQDSSGIISEMEKKYPGLPGREALEFGAKVFAGETPWVVASPFPSIGKTAEVNLGGSVFDLHFKDNRTLLLDRAPGGRKGVQDTVTYSTVEVGKNIFMVYWNEPQTGSNVVQVQNWNTGEVYINMTKKDGTFSYLKGTIRIK